MLGASTWRIEEITGIESSCRLRPACPASLRSGRAKGSGGRRSSGRIGRASRELVALSDAKAETVLRGGITSTSGRGNLVTYLREQEAASGVVPSDRSIVVERFRDEIGDWRVCVLTPFGGRVHAPGDGARRTAQGLIGHRRAVDLVGRRHRARLPDADVPPLARRLLLDPADIEELVIAEPGSRRSSGRASGKRLARAPHPASPSRPANAALAAAVPGAEPAPGRASVCSSRSCSRPYRECLQDVFDLPALRGILQGIQTRNSISSRSRRRRPRRSRPRSSSTTSRRTCTRTTRPPRNAASGALPRPRPLRELMGVEELRELLDLGAIEQVEASLSSTPRNADELHDLLRRAGPLFDDEYDRGFAETLLRERRAIRVRLGGMEPLAAVEDAGLFGTPSVRCRPEASRTSSSSRYPRTGGRPATLRTHARPVHHRRGCSSFRIELGVGKASPPTSSVTRSSFAVSFVRRQRARVVRHRRPAAHSPCDVCRAAPRGRARRPGRWRPVLAWHGNRATPDAPRGAGSARGAALPAALEERRVAVVRALVTVAGIPMRCALRATWSWVALGWIGVAAYFEDAELLGAAGRLEQRRRVGARGDRAGVGGGELPWVEIVART